ncbi:hypothetical protein SNEBB_004540 [Seison nebaliae]|nr:hypothetical protein SNEBB_004540 [Seison nebaliae]
MPARKSARLQKKMKNTVELPTNLSTVPPDKLSGRKSNCSGQSRDEYGKFVPKVDGSVQGKNSKNIKDNESDVVGSSKKLTTRKELTPQHHSIIGDGDHLYEDYSSIRSLKYVHRITSSSENSSIKQLSFVDELKKIGKLENNNFFPLRKEEYVICSNDSEPNSKKSESGDSFNKELTNMLNTTGLVKMNNNLNNSLRRLTSNKSMSKLSNKLDNLNDDTLLDANSLMKTNSICSIRRTSQEIFQQMQNERNAAAEPNLANEINCTGEPAAQLSVFQRLINLTNVNVAILLVNMTMLFLLLLIYFENMIDEVEDF